MSTVKDSSDSRIVLDDVQVLGSTVKDLKAALSSHDVVIPRGARKAALQQLLLKTLREYRNASVIQEDSTQSNVKCDILNNESHIETNTQRDISKKQEHTSDKIAIEKTSVQKGADDISIANVGILSRADSETVIKNNSSTLNSTDTSEAQKTNDNLMMPDSVIVGDDLTNKNDITEGAPMGNEQETTNDSTTTGGAMDDVTLYLSSKTNENDDRGDRGTPVTTDIKTIVDADPTSSDVINDVINDIITTTTTTTSTTTEIAPSVTTSTNSSQPAIKPSTNSIQDYRLFIGNLPRNTTTLDIVAVLREFGTILDCNIVQDRKTGNIKGYGFVTYDNVDSAQKALKAGVNGLPILSNKCNVGPVAGGSTSNVKQFNQVFVGNIPKDTKRGAIKSFFQANYGDVSFVKLYSAKNSRESNYTDTITSTTTTGLITFSDAIVACEVSRKCRINFSDKCVLTVQHNDAKKLESQLKREENQHRSGYGAYGMRGVNEGSFNSHYDPNNQYIDPSNSYDSSRNRYYHGDEFNNTQYSDDYYYNQQRYDRSRPPMPGMESEYNPYHNYRNHMNSNLSPPGYNPNSRFPSPATRETVPPVYQYHDSGYYGGSNNNNNNNAAYEPPLYYHREDDYHSYGNNNSGGNYHSYDASGYGGSIDGLTPSASGSHVYQNHPHDHAHGGPAPPRRYNNIAKRHKRNNGGPF